MQKRIPAVMMRGGTSKGLFFHKNHLPSNAVARDRVLLAAYGSPDPGRRQIDGVGGGVSTTSKAAIISASPSPDYDVVYNFGQVSLDRPIVDFKGNCGNISSAVGPFAVDEGLVPVVEPITRVRIHQQNTNKLIVAEVPVKDGHAQVDGDYAIDGVPGAGAKIVLRFVDPGGSLTGRLFPTGNRKDALDLPGVGMIDITFIDAANPVVLVPATAIGLTGAEIDRIDADAHIRELLETIRCRAAVMVGLADSEAQATRSSQAVPKIAMVAPSQDYVTSGGKNITAGDIDLTARMMSMGTLHRAFAVSGAVSVAGAAMIPGTVVNSLVADGAEHAQMLRIGHPSGTIDVGAQVAMDGDRWIYQEAVLGRTARRLMEGYVRVPGHFFA